VLNSLTDSDTAHLTPRKAVVYFHSEKIHLTSFPSAFNFLLNSFLPWKSELRLPAPSSSLAFLQTPVLSTPLHVSLVHPSKPPKSRQEVGFVFKLGIFQPGYYHLALSYSAHNNLTYALILCKTKLNSVPTDTTILQNLHTHTSFTTHPLLLPLIIVDLCIASSATRIESVDYQLDELEETTGQHEWVNRPRGDPMELDFVSVTRKLNFISGTLGGESMRVKGTLLTLEKIVEEIDLLVLSGSGDSGAGNLKGQGKVLKEMVAYYSNKCQNLSLRAEFEEKRVQTQIAVVCSLILQSSLIFKIKNLTDIYRYTNSWRKKTPKSISNLQKQRQL